MRFKISKESKKQFLTGSLFLKLLAIVLLLCVVFFKRTILNPSFNMFPLFANIILVSLLSLIKDEVERREVYKLLIIGMLVLIFDNLILVKQWFQISLFNFYGIMYCLYFYIYGVKIVITNSIQRGYVCFINYFLAFYLLLFNIDIILDNFFFDTLAIQVVYIDFGIKIMILFISVLTFLSVAIQKIRFINTDHDTDMEVKMEVNEYSNNRDIAIDFEELGDVILANKISDFFEKQDSYLEVSFSLACLSSSLSISSTLSIKRIINEQLDTTFQKLVAKYRIRHALYLLENDTNWTLDALANNCGFKSVNTFKKYFKQYMGLSPCNYRMNYF